MLHLLLEKSTILLQTYFAIFTTSNHTEKQGNKVQVEFFVRNRYQLRYSYLSIKRSPTIILFGKIFQALHIYQRPYVYLFLKKIMENWAKIEKSGYFQKLLYLAL